MDRLQTPPHSVEAEQAGNLPRALARDDYVLLVLNGYGEKRFAHGLGGTASSVSEHDDTHVVAPAIIVAEKNGRN